MNKFMKSLAANMKQVRAEYNGTEDPFEKLNLAWEVARLMLESLDTIIEMAAQIEAQTEALEAIDVADELARLDRMRGYDERRGLTGSTHAGLVYAQLDHPDVLILRGLAIRNPLTPDKVVITQRGIDHLKSLL